jgi:hypothetical protein
MYDIQKHNKISVKNRIWFMNLDAPVAPL